MIFNGVTDTCPLCGNDVEEGGGRLKRLAAKTVRIGRVECTLLQLFFVFAVNVAIVSVIVNVALGVRDHLWSVYPFVGIFTLYCVFALLFGHLPAASFLRRIALLHFIGVTVLQFVSHEGWWLYGYYLPILMLVANLCVVIVFFLSSTKRVSLYCSEVILVLMCTALLVLWENGVIPAAETDGLLIVVSFSVGAFVFANYTVYMLFCLKDKFRTIIK